MKKISHKKQRLQNLHERLQKGEDVAVRDLKNALTEVEFNEYVQMWAWHQQSRSLGNDGSSGYDEFLKKGLFHYNKAESGRFEKSVAKRFHNKAQDCFEKALEQLSVDVQVNPLVAAAYDRQLDFSASGNLSLSPVGMPRRVNSKSLDNLSEVICGVRVKKTKRDFKIQIVKQSLADVNNRKESVEGEEGKVRKVSKEGKVEEVKGLDVQGKKLAEMLRKLNLAAK